MPTKHKNVYKKNLARVDSLIDLYKKAEDLNLPRETLRTDILRASVVFLHGAQEDYIRSVLVELLPFSRKPDALEKLRIITKDGLGKSDRVTLDGLKVYREKTIDEYIKQVVTRNLEQQTFNNVSEIIAWLSKVEITLDEFDEKAAIDELTLRRHKIVHEVDKTPYGSGNHNQQASSRSSVITESQVKNWKSASKKLIDCIDSQVERILENKNGNPQELDTTEKSGDGNGIIT